MLIIVGQGNPGEKFAHNRHNIGFLALKAIAAREAKIAEAEARIAQTDE